MIVLLSSLFTGLLGLAFGSFLNVCLSRWPQGESIVAPRSRCNICRRTLCWCENVPLLSWLLLRGRCRTCRTWIGWRYPLVEALVGGLWALLGFRWASQVLLPDAFPTETILNPPHSLLEALSLAILLFLLVGLAVLDFEHLWLADAVTIPGTVLGLAFLLFLANFAQLSALNIFQILGSRLIAVLIAAGLILAIRWLYWLLRHQEGIGLGDAKLMALLAAWLGLKGALMAFVLGVFLGAIAAVFLLVSLKHHARIQHNAPAHKPADALPIEDAAEVATPSAWGQQQLPLGTFLCAGGILSALWGEGILRAYLQLF